MSSVSVQNSVAAVTFDLLEASQILYGRPSVTSHSPFLCEQLYFYESYPGYM